MPPIAAQFAEHLRREGIDVCVIQALLGHRAEERFERLPAGRESRMRILEVNENLGALDGVPCELQAPNEQFRKGRRFTGAA